MHCKHVFGEKGNETKKATLLSFARSLWRSIQQAFRFTFLRSHQYIFKRKTGCSNKGLCLCGSLLSQIAPVDSVSFHNRMSIRKQKVQPQINILCPQVQPSWICSICFSAANAPCHTTFTLHSLQNPRNELTVVANIGPLDILPDQHDIESSPGARCSK